MGRSLRSCFKIIYCAGDAANNDDGLPLPESKTSPTKRTWSFQKRSLAHHVPSSHMISESVPIVIDRQDLGADVVTINSGKATVSQKPALEEQTNESPSLPFIGVPSVESEQFTDKSTDKVLYNIEGVVIVQASIRGYLAKREFEKIRNIVKLQAAIRRYMVKRQAVGTLRCIMAIFKIQQIIRARNAIRSKDFTTKENLSEKTTTEMVKYFESKSNKTALAIRKLASSLFASQLLKSTLQTKAIHICCNPSQPDAGWMWLERWMSLTLSDQQKIVSSQDDLGENVNSTLIAHAVKNEFQVMPEHVSSDPKFVSSDPATMSEVREYVITNSSEATELEVPSSLQGQISNSLSQNHHLKSHDGNETWLEENSESVLCQMSLITVAGSDLELNSHHNKLDYSEERHTSSTQKEANATQELEAGEVVIGSRKLKNPGFAAVQAKFEELSAASNSNKSLSIAFRDARSDSKPAHIDSMTEEESDRKSVYLNVGDTRKEINTSPITDKSEYQPSEITSEIKASKENASTISSSSNFSIGDTNVEAKDLSWDSGCSKNAASLVQVERKSEESNTLNTQELSATKSALMDRSSQGSPINHIAVTESNGASSSLMPMHAKATKVEYITPVRQKKTQVAISNSPTDYKNVSVEQTSGDHLKTGTKSANRRNSFSMVKADHVQQTSSNHLLPSYMKPTESTIAKVSTTLPQKSSPDVHEKENHVKKRNSLPNGEVKEGSSPRMQRSTSQVQQNSKGNGIHSPQNSAERRWVR